MDPNQQQHPSVTDLVSSSEDEDGDGDDDRHDEDEDDDDDNSFIEMDLDDNDDSGGDDSSSSDDEELSDLDNVDDDELDEDDMEVINQGSGSAAAAAAEPTARPRRTTRQTTATANNPPPRVFLDDSGEPMSSSRPNLRRSTRTLTRSNNVEPPPPPPPPPPAAMDDTLIRKLCNPQEQGGGGKDSDDLVMEDFYCPILLALPLNPVVAADGRIYERSEIEQHLKKNGAKSPWTNLPMSSVTLHEVPDIFFTTLETKITNGQFQGEMADAWMKKWKAIKKARKDKEDFDELLFRAEGGNVPAMEKVADCYQTGEYGVKIDHYEAFKWYDKANQAGSVIGKGNVGEMLVKGSGVKKNVLKGQREMFTAMMQGSDYAAYALGMDYANGDNGLPEDQQLAIQLLTRCLNEKESMHRNMDHEEIAEAREKLEELTRE